MCRRKGCKTPIFHKRHCLQHHAEEIIRLCSHDMQMTIEQVLELIQRPCSYCGYASHGIDRIDNKIEYTWDNCIPCCSECNFRKWKSTIDEFVQSINRIHDSFCVNYKLGTIDPKILKKCVSQHNEKPVMANESGAESDHRMAAACRPSQASGCDDIHS